MRGNKGYKIEKDVIIINRELTGLDLFLKKFINVLNKYSNYLVVSGFVSISTGRARGTEDIDMLVPVMDKKKFSDLFKDLEKNGFWCYQGDTPQQAYNYIKDMKNIRFAETSKMFPNIELVPIDESKEAKFFEFSHPQKIKVKNFEFKIPPIEFEILYKEMVLSGEKDIADAKHLRTFFSGLVKEEKFRKYKKIIVKEIK